MRLTGLTMIGVYLLAGSAVSQEENCQFLNDCLTTPPTNAPTPTIPQMAQPRSAQEHLDRCLAYYVSRNGPFVPEGRSTKQVKSRSDMSAMCTFAIQQENYFWDHPSNHDWQANLNCCVKVMGKNASMCSDIMNRMRASNADYDYCLVVHNSQPSDNSSAPPRQASTCAGAPEYNKEATTRAYCDKIVRPMAAIYRREIANGEIARNGGNPALYKCLLRDCRL